MKKSTKTQPQEEYDKTFEFVQLGDKLRYDHENDTDNYIYEIQKQTWESNKQSQLFQRLNSEKILTKRFHN